MIKIFKIIPVIFVSTMLPFTTNAFAEALVVDDSENYALLEQQTTDPSSVVNEANNDGYDDSEAALAQDNMNDALASDNLDLSSSLKGLRQEIQELRGQLEVQAHEIKILKEQQLTFYKDLDSRIQGSNSTNLSKNENSAADKDPGEQRPIQASTSKNPEEIIPTVTPVMSHVSANTNPADEQISYLAAYELVKNKQFDDALVAMNDFLAKYPNGYYSANAQYWTGELYLTEKNYQDAISHFDVVLQQFPSSNKYSASLLKLGYALAGSGRIGEAQARLREVMKKYPDTNTSELAQLKLKEISGSL
ncbi:MAG: tol-pal system protein YbgF [Legionellaceae bacterium]|nr:tol-pal system protein YbgF [Legionellaceae bacterium]